MKSYKKIFFSCFLFTTLLFCKEVNAQNKIDIDLGFLYLNSFNNDQTGQSLKVETLYRLSDNFKVGIGIRLERLENPGYNTLPIFGSVELKNRFLRNSYFYGNLGYALEGDEGRAFTKGLLAELGIRYFIPIRRDSNSGFLFQLGYNYKSMNLDWYKSDRSSLAIGVSYRLGI